MDDIENPNLVEYENNENINQGGEDYSDDDIYLLELHKRLTMMKNERKKAEQDAKLLDNRLRLLKGEEEKTWKKIATTKKKTNEKIIGLQKTSEEMKQRQHLTNIKEKEIENKKM